MAIGVTEEHTALADAVRRWVADHAPLQVLRGPDGDGGEEDPEVWSGLADQGLLGMHVAEEHGGAGGTPLEAAVACEQLGRGLAGAAFLPSIVVSTLLQIAGGPTTRYLPDLAAGKSTAAVVLGGEARLALNGAPADLMLLQVPAAGAETVWALVEAAQIRIDAVASLDTMRPVARVTVDDLAVTPDDVVAVTDDTVADVAVTLGAAEAAGIAGWCLDTAVEYAKVRTQFGRPIGQFQAVKHACADMLTKVEQAQAAAWDAARALDDPQQRPLAAAVAGAIALDAAVECAKACIQILGGIGFTWEHDAHRYLRRAMSLRQLLGPASRWRAQACRIALGGGRRELRVDLDDDQAQPIRSQVRAFLAALPDDPDGRRRALAAAGYIQPHWPQPYGRGAGAVEQLVIDEEFAAAGVKRPDLVIGGWILPTLISHGTPQQQERFVVPTLEGTITWCQMFSEPGAGSDLAALSTRATKVDGGWVLNGQKVWTSLAHRSDFGLTLARTNPAAPKHEGITCFVVDMKSAGLDIRPLRELTGRAMFNEVFLNDVFVPDEMVVGTVDDGWRAGRTTLANERVAMTTGSTMGAGVEGVLRMVGALPHDPVVWDRVGALVAEGQVLSLLGLRTTLRRLEGVDPGAASSVRKLVGMHHAQDCAELAVELLGPAGATSEDAAGAITGGFLQSRCLTIAGGTTEVQRNVVGERLLGLPRDDATAAP